MRTLRSVTLYDISRAKTGRADRVVSTKKITYLSPKKTLRKKVAPCTYVMVPGCDNKWARKFQTNDTVSGRKETRYKP